MRLILRGSPAITAAARAYAATLDVAPKQIALEVRVAELSREDALTLGFDWNILDTGGILTSIGLKETPGSPNFNSSFRGGHSLTGQLDQLLDKRHLIARPNLLALDGRESEVFIGDIVKYIQSIQTDDQGRQQITLGQDRVGVRLPVLARAGADGNITLDIQPAVSTITGFLDVPGGGQVPQISIRTTQSSAVIKSGETIALGGLIREEDRKQVSGVPILKDLPIVGALFRKTQNSLLKTEIVFFLTAKIVDANDRANAAAPKSEGGQQP
jgi:type II secretory pathway component GspD/PulD (secretin)